jgi:hypothetical protein
VARMAPGFHAWFQRLEQRVLGGHIFENGFDDDIGMRHAVAIHIRNQAIKSSACLSAGHAGDERTVCRPVAGRTHAFQALVLQRHGHATQGAPGGNVAAHDASANDMNALRLERRFLAEAFQALLQEEDADQIASRRRIDDAVDQLRGGQRIAVVFRPQVDDRVGRRVVFRTRLGCHLLAGAIGDDALNGPFSRRCRQR